MDLSSDVQLAVWGCIDSGMPDHSAEVAELGYAFFEPAWDSTRRDQSTIRLNGKELPEWMALPYVGEHIRRGHASCQERG